MTRFAASALLFALLCCAATAEAAAARPDARILLYHRVGDARYPTTNVSLEEFRHQMKWLADEGYTVVPTRRIEAFLLEGEPLPPKAVALHFDDGLRSVYTNAFPVLKEFGYPFAVFLPTEAVDNRYPDYVTWEMVAEMARAKGEFSAHGHTHSRLSGPGAGESAEAFRGRVRAEFVRSRDELARHGLEARWAAYSFGEHGPDLLQSVREAGFKLGFTQDPGAVGPKSDPFILPRYAVVGSVAEFSLFRQRVGYAPLELSSQWPPRGELKAPPTRFGAVLAEPERYDPLSVSLYVSEWGGIPSRYDSATGRVEAVTSKPLKKHFNRVIVTAREKDTGRFGLVSWSIVNNL